MDSGFKENLNTFKDFWNRYKKGVTSVLLILIVLFLILVIGKFLFKKFDKWTAVYYEVTFNTNGGTIINSKKVRKGKTLSDDVITTKTGFDFVGWNYENSNFDLNTPIKSDMTLSANWKSNGSTVVHTVSFETYGGTIIQDIEVSEGKTFTKPFNPEKEGYTFEGWYLGEIPYDFVKTGVSTDITLKAKWKKNIAEKENATELEKSAYIFNQISGTWYLMDYEDIYLTVSEEDNGFGENWYFLKWYNIDLLKDYSLYPRKNYQRIFSTEKQDFYMKINQLNFYLTENMLVFEHGDKVYKFVREIGTKNKYTDTTYEKSVGRWYLENSYSSYIDITSLKQESILDYDTYCIETTNINLDTLQLGSSINYGCLKVYDESLFKNLGITIENELLTVKNAYGTKYFTLNKVVEEGSVTGVKLNKVALTLEVGNASTLYATVFPKEAKNTKVIWESSDSNIVEVIGNPNATTVSSEGTRYSATLKAKKAGVATITVKTIDGNHTATSKILVPGIEVNTISLNKRNTTLYVGNFEQLKATILPSNASNQNLIWSSSNPEVVTVNSTGTLEAKSEGEAVITVMSEDGKKKAICQVLVKYPTLKVMASMTETRKLISGNYVNGISVIATPSGGSGSYQKYEIKLYYNHELVQEGNEASLFYPTELSGTYRASITVTDTEGHKLTITKEYIKK